MKADTLASLDIDPTRRRSSSTRPILSWAPLITALSAMALFALLILVGGPWRVWAWWEMQLVLPVAGLVLLAHAWLTALVKRRLSGLTLLSSGIALVCGLPVTILYLHVPYPASVNSSKPSVTVRLPAEARLKVLWGGDTYEANFNHVFLPDQRWAYDLAVAPYLVGSPDLAAYGCYGVPIVAPATGLVVRAHDGEPDMIPGALSNNTVAPEGNTIAIRLDETGTYLVIGHLKPGSLRVVVGERVEEGQAIAQCGNSGNTSEPHIHIHHQREDPNIVPLNWAEGLPLFFRGHLGDPMPEGGIQIEDGKACATGATVQSIAPPGTSR